MVLMAKYLGANQAVLGIFLALCPLLALLQIPAAGIAKRWGLKKLFLAGWGGRTWVLVLLIPVPLLVDKAPAWVLLWWWMAAMIGFNASRGFASGAWLPWLTEIVPASQRGRYLAWENIVVNAGSLLSMLAFALLMPTREGQHPQGWMYALMVGAAATFGMVSLWFVSRAGGGNPAPIEEQGIWFDRERYREAWAAPDFRRIVRFGVWQSLTLGAFGGFVIVYIKDVLKVPDGMTLYFSISTLVGSMVAAAVVSRLLDRTGGRPVLRCGSVAMLLLLIAWTLNADNKLLFSSFAIATQFFLIGFTGTAVGIPQTRLLMAACPATAKTEGMTIYQVGNALAGGLSPLGWGFLLERMKAPGAEHPGADAYVVFFGMTALMLFFLQFLISRLREQQAMSTREFLGTMIVSMPLRLVADIADTPRFLVEKIRNRNDD
jgi:Na+/melibiose symporter-like transporter